jgi:acyl-coenzyme A synthetase/AMP-(fatty) acid ligase
MLGEMCHVLGLGARVICPVGTPHDLEAQLAEHGVTVICTSPALMSLLVQQTAPPPPGLRLEVIRTTAAALDPALKRALEARYSAIVVQEFGQSECLTILRPASPEVPASGVGHPPPGVDIRLIDSA